MGIESFVLDRETPRKELAQVMDGFRKALSQGKSVAFVVRKSALPYDGSVL